MSTGTLRRIHHSDSTKSLRPLPPNDNPTPAHQAFIEDNPKDPRDPYEEFKVRLGKSRNRDPNSLIRGLEKLASVILTDGIPTSEGQASLRPVVWKIMLKVDQLDTAKYLEYVSKGPSSVSAKIKNDTFRTLATDTQFKGKVKEDMLIRLLEAFVWRNSGDNRQGPSFTYVQGMNVLAAPFLYTMPTQLEAFACFANFIENCCPLYVQPTLTGVHRGLKLLDRCLAFLNEDLYDHLRKKNLTAEIYAFPSVMTLCACTPPLDEVLKLWDFLLTFGVHLNILCVAAQVLQMTEQLLAAPSPMKILRTFPPLNAESVITTAAVMAGDLPKELYEELVAHPFVP